MKAPNAKALSGIARKVFGDVKEVPKIVHEGRKALYSGEGVHSFALWPLMTALKKLKGKGRIEGVVYDKYLRKLKNADERLGKTLAQHGPSESLFAVKETVPTKLKLRGLPASVEHETYSALAPVTKSMSFAAPMMAGLYMSDKLSGGEEKKAMDSRQLMKQAADALEKHRRRDDVIKLAMLMVERGKCEPFSTMADLEEKIASLEVKNLEAVKEALDMDANLSDLGKVASENVTPNGTSKAESNFWHRLSE